MNPDKDNLIKSENLKPVNLRTYKYNTNELPSESYRRS